jgi:uncharacterized protein YrrD
MNTLFKSLTKYAIRAKDGDLGHIRDLFFDDSSWRVRYLVVDTSFWLLGRKVMVSPSAIETDQPLPDRMFAVALTKEKIRNSPAINHDVAVSRQMESHLSDYYGWPAYWSEAAQRAGEAYPFAHPDLPYPPQYTPPRQEPEAHLRSTSEILSYHLLTSDEKYYELKDVLLNTSTWQISHLVVKTGTWRKSHLVLLPQILVNEINWFRREVVTAATNDELESAPEFSLDVFNRTYESDLLNHFQALHPSSSPAKERATHAG